MRKTDVPQAMVASSGLPSKAYFRIGEVAELVGVEPHVLRYWEREFRTIRPTKSSRGQRVYSRRDVENLLRVRDLLYRERFTIAGAKKRLGRSAGDDAYALDGEAAAVAAPETPPATMSVPPPASSPGVAAHATVEVAVQAAIATADVTRAHEQLVAMRDEIRAFLAELDSANS